MDSFYWRKLLLRREPENIKDHLAVCELKDGEIVGHIHFNISNAVLRECNKTVIGKKVNIDAGFGSCKYEFY